MYVATEQLSCLEKIVNNYMTSRKSQTGFSLIELLVALSINLVIVAAAAYLYLGTSDAKRALDQQQALNESGQFALDIVGRDIVNAGFFPANLNSNPALVGQTARVSGRYSNPLPAVPAFASGVFGCSGQRLDPGTVSPQCVAHASSANTADTIVVNYFTNDRFTKGAASQVLGDIGKQTDCSSSIAANSSANVTRRNPNVDLPPLAPLFVSNSYTLATTTFSIENQTINTLSLTCAGSGNAGFQPIIAGIESLQFRYGVYIDADTLQPSRFYEASEMAALGNVNVNGVDRDAWARVVSVEICLVARALQQTKTTSSTGAVTPYVNCTGASVTPTDRSIRRVYRKVFAMRNNLTQIIVPFN